MSTDDLPDAPRPSPTGRPRRIPYVLAGLTALLLWGFASVADEVIEGETTVFDDAVTAFFRDRADPSQPWGPDWFQEAVRDVTGLGSFTVLGFILIVTVLYFAMAGRSRTAIFVGFSVVGGTILSTALKELFDRPRPDMAEAARVFTSETNAFVGRQNNRRKRDSHEKTPDPHQHRRRGGSPGPRRRLRHRPTLRRPVALVEQRTGQTGHRRVCRQNHQARFAGFCTARRAHRHV